MRQTKTKNMLEKLREMRLPCIIGSIDVFVTERLYWALSTVINPGERHAPYDIADLCSDDGDDLFMAELCPLAGVRLYEALRYCEASSDWETFFISCNTLCYRDDNYNWEPTVQDIFTLLPEVLCDRYMVAEALTPVFRNDECDESVVVLYISNRLGRLLDTLRERKAECDTKWQEIVSLCGELAHCYDMGWVFWTGGQCVIAGYVEACYDCGVGFSGPDPAALIIPQRMDELADDLEKKYDGVPTPGREST